MTTQNEEHERLHEKMHSAERIPVERVQTGVRIEKRLLKVLKGVAEYVDLSLGDLLEGIVLHSFEGGSPFRKETIEKIEDLKKIYEMDYDASASHLFVEEVAAPKKKNQKTKP
jgi:hypothetical protein